MLALQNTDSTRISGEGLADGDCAEAVTDS